MPVGVWGISFHVEGSEIFHNAHSALFHVLRKQNISLYAFAPTNVVLVKKKRTESAKTFSVLFLLVGNVFYSI